LLADEYQSNFLTIRFALIIYLQLSTEKCTFVQYDNKIMTTTNYTNFRQDLKAFLDNVNANHTPLIVTRPKGEDVVVLSKADFDSIEETFYLLRNPKNAMRLLKGLEDYEKQLGQQRNLIEE
jgi:antitoxin YefM